MSLIQGTGGGLGGAGAPGGALGNFYSHLLDQSLKFNDDDSQALSRTPASAGNRKTYTWSAWIKRSTLGATMGLFGSYSAGNNADSIYFGFASGNQFIISLHSLEFRRTTRLFRDTSAWYNIVVAIDTTDGTAGNRVKIYVNGVEETSFSTTNNPSQNDDTGINQAAVHYLGRRADTTNYFDGYLAEVNLIDGTALTADSFGETKNGIWIPKDTSGLTFGTNGFHLTFKNDVVSEGFNTALYEGNNGTQSISGVGFAPGFIWAKNRDSSSYHHDLYDYVRGNNLRLNSSQTAADATGYLTFHGDGFSLTSGGGINTNNNSHVAWCWEAGGAPTATNSAGAGATPTAGSVKIDGSNLGSALAGTIPATKISADTSKGFSVVAFTGNGSAGATIAHGLSAAPDWILLKSRDNARDWRVYHTSLGATKTLDLNKNTSEQGPNAAYWNNTAPTSSVFSVGSVTTVNGNGEDYIAYCWTPISGYSKFGSYTGSGSSGKAITGLGFKPAWLMVKASSGTTGSWIIWDNTRDVNDADVDNPLFADVATSEFTSGGTYDIQFDSDGFTINNTSNNHNGSGHTYIYMAFADTREAAFFKDVSTNGNHFTPVQLDYRDSFPDSPTNNFATLNPIHKYWNLSYPPTISEGNLKTYTASNYWATTLGNMGVSSGKWYAEFIVTTGASPASVASVGILDIGANNAIDTNHFIGYETNSVSYYGSNGTKYISSTASAYGNTWGLGDILGVALDLDAGTVKFYKNNTVQNSGTAATTGLSGTFVFGCAVYATTAIVANFGQDSSFSGIAANQNNADDNGIGDFYYAPPSGHLAVCSANLPDAAIIDGTDHFNTVLWTGTGSGGTRAVSGVGFSPDWVWAKNITQNYSHVLYDSVRGAGNDKEFQSNDTAAEGDGNNNQYGYLSAFDSDGFTSTSGSEGDANNLYFNESSQNYAAWNWKAGGATPTKTYTVKVVSDSGNKYRFDDFGTSAVTLNLQEGGTYTFDQSDSSNAGHPLRFSTTSDGTHGGGSEYTTGVTTTGTPGNAGAKTVITVAASAATLYYYCTQHSGMGGQANTNATFGSTNFDGSLLSTVSANTDAGFSIVSYSGSNSAGSFGHGLSQAAELVIIKQRNNASFWATGYNVPDWTWSSDYIQLQDDAPKGADGGSTIFTSAPSSTVVNIGGGSVTSTSGKNLIAYCFHSVEGYSKIGQYEGNNLVDGTFVYTGFRPAFLLVKNLDATAQWLLLDNKRDPFNVGDDYTSPDLPNAFAAVSGGFYDFLSNGFKWRLGSTLGSANTAHTYVYYAVAEQPFKFANAR